MKVELTGGEWTIRYDSLNACNYSPVIRSGCQDAFFSVETGNFPYLKNKVEKQIQKMLSPLPPCRELKALEEQYLLGFK